MSGHPRWKTVSADLRGAAAGPTTEQIELAKYLGLPGVAAGTPRHVAAVVLRRALNGPLQTSYRSEPVGDGSLKYLAAMAKEVRRRCPTEVDRELLDAWLLTFWGLRSARALTALKLNVQDIVRRPATNGLFVVTTIGGTGLVHFGGGPGQRAWPHTLELAARAGSDKYDELRYRAEQQAGSRRKLFGPPGHDALESMRKWRVTAEPTVAAQGAFDDALETATDEKPMQKVIQQYPEILSHILRGTQGRWVIPQKSLGGQLVPDFVVASLTSSGLEWTLVELESPKAPLTISDGQAEARVRKGMKQITDWREWLAENLDFARKQSNGLGLINIRQDAQGLVIVGRGEPTAAVEPTRARARSESRIEVRTYDWLQRAMRTTYANGFGQLYREIPYDDEF